MNDYISRQAAIDVLEERLQANGYSNVALVSELNRSIGYLMRLPSVEAEPVRHGHWIDMADFEQCSSCSGTRLKEIQTVYGKAIWIKTPYCPNCGARMNEVE